MISVMFYNDFFFSLVEQLHVLNVDTVTALIYAKGQNLDMNYGCKVTQLLHSAALANGPRVTEVCLRHH